MSQKKGAAGWTEELRKCSFFWICVLFSFHPTGITSAFWAVSVHQVLPRGCKLHVHPQSLSSWTLSDPSSESQLAKSSTCGSQKCICWLVTSSLKHKGQLAAKTEQKSYWFSWKTLEFNIIETSSLLSKLISGFTGYWKRLADGWTGTKHDHTSPVFSG